MNEELKKIIELLKVVQDKCEDNEKYIDRKLSFIKDEVSDHFNNALRIFDLHDYLDGELDFSIGYNNQLEYDLTSGSIDSGDFDFCIEDSFNDAAVKFEEIEIKVVIALAAKKVSLAEQNNLLAEIDSTHEQTSTEEKSAIHTEPNSSPVQ